MNPFKTHGAVSWHELLVADPHRARDFYGNVLGWQFQEMPMPDGSPYHVAQAGALAAGGIMKRPSDDIPPCWTFYVTADDVRDLVGRHDLNVVVPVEESPAGPFCGFFDPQGAYVSAIEYNEEAGTGAVTDFRDAFRTHGLFSWFELLTADPAAAADFYGSLFGWSATEREIPGGTYQILQIGEIGFGGIAKSPDARDPVPLERLCDGVRHREDARGGAGARCDRPGPDHGDPRSRAHDADRGSRRCLGQVHRVPAHGRVAVMWPAIGPMAQRRSKRGPGRQLA